MHALGSTYTSEQRAPLMRMQRRVLRAKSARRARSRPAADRCRRAVRGRSSKSRGAEPRAKSAAGVQLTPVDGPVDDHLEVEKVAVSGPLSPKAPEQCAGQPSRQYECAKSQGQTVDGFMWGVGPDGHFPSVNGDAPAGEESSGRAFKPQAYHFKSARVAVRGR